MIQDLPAAASGAKREKLHALPYDLIPFQEIADAYVRVAEFGAKKYTEYWSDEWVGLSNVKNVAKIKISLPEECARDAITRLKELGLFQSESLDLSENVLSVTKKERSKFSAPESAAVAMNDDSRLPMSSIIYDRNKIPASTTEKTRNTGSSNSETEQMTLFLRSVISEQNFSRICEIWESQRQSTLNTKLGAAQSVGPLLTFTLTTTMEQVFSVAFFARDATTVSGFWATISQVLQKHSLIYERDVRVSYTGCWNWSKGLSRIQLLGSLLRHTFAYLRGEERDNGPKGSGLLHTDHILWNAVALVHNVHWNLEDGRRAEPPRAYKASSTD